MDDEVKKSPGESCPTCQGLAASEEILRLRHLLMHVDLAQGLMFEDPPGSKAQLGMISVGPDGSAARLLCLIPETENFTRDLARVVGGEEGKLILLCYEARAKQEEPKDPAPETRGP